MGVLSSIRNGNRQHGQLVLWRISHFSTHSRWNTWLHSPRLEEQINSPALYSPRHIAQQSAWSERCVVIPWCVEAAFEGLGTIAIFTDRWIRALRSFSLCCWSSFEIAAVLLLCCSNSNERPTIMQAIEARAARHTQLALERERKLWGHDSINYPANQSKSVTYNIIFSRRAMP